jgi:extracellular factor (EF) 3-hydroxypalmitic acid methyl ester biosynthesis protein
MVSGMMQNDLAIEALLDNGDQRIPVTAKYASRYSLWIKFRRDCEFTYDDIFNLIIQNNGECLEIGPCRLISDPAQISYNGRLVFLQNVYDIHSLLSKNKAVKLQSIFHDLPTLLARKKKISQSFKDFTANLTYDLSIYKNLFDHFDSKYQEEPKPIKKSVQRALIKTEGQKFKRFLNEKLAEMERLVAGFSTEEHQRHGFYFRKQIRTFILSSAFMTRTNLKPRGYPGDSEMMRMVYLNEYKGNTTFEKLMHKFPLEQPGAQSVRNRKKIIVEFLNQIKNTDHISSNQRIKILSLACGPAIEIEDILASPTDAEKYHITLLDQDSTALREAADLICGIEKKSNVKVKVDYLTSSVRLMIANKKLKRKIGTHHFIYSLGLFDYLTQRVARAVLESLYQLLKPGGTMIIGNFHISNQSKCFLDYWLDWSLIHRTENEFLGLIKDLPSVKASIFFEDTGNQMFLKIRKMDNGK